MNQTDQTNQTNQPPAEPSIEVTLTVAQARTVVDEIIALRQGTLLAPGQTPLTDRLVNTLIIMIAEIEGTIRVYPGITPSARSIRRALEVRARDERDRRDVPTDHSPEAA